jgi:CubicO group peptidase (beta-lactamase class C family)
VTVAAAVTLLFAVTTLSACGTTSADAQPATRATHDPATASGIGAIVRDAMKTQNLRAVIVKVTRGNRVITSRAFGESMTGVPATTDMHFRQGAVAFAYIGTLLMEFVDEHKVSLDDTIDHWMPELPESNRVTLKMLTDQTTGYPDFETDPAWLKAFYDDPFHIFTFQERLKYAFERPIEFPPGTNWSYAHTNFMILGEILARIGKQPLATLLREKVLEPMGLHDTVATETSEIPSPVLHSFSTERLPGLGITPPAPVDEDVSFWNAQWGSPIGGNETSTIDDMATTARKVGTGSLISRQSYDLMTGPHLLGFGHKEPSCEPSCFTQVNAYNFGLGVVRSGSWILQDPLLPAYGATEAYLPSQRISIAVVVTFLPAAINAQGIYPNASDTLFRSIGRYVAPSDPPPSVPT